MSTLNHSFSRNSRLSAFTKLCTMLNKDPQLVSKKNKGYYRKPNNRPKASSNKNVNKRPSNSKSNKRQTERVSKWFWYKQHRLNLTTLDYPGISCFTGIATKRALFSAGKFIKKGVQHKRGLLKNQHISSQAKFKKMLFLFEVHANKTKKHNLSIVQKSHTIDFFRAIKRNLLPSYYKSKQLPFKKSRNKNRKKRQYMLSFARYSFNLTKLRRTGRFSKSYAQKGFLSKKLISRLWSEGFLRRYCQLIWKEPLPFWHKFPKRWSNIASTISHQWHTKLYPRGLEDVAPILGRGDWQSGSFQKSKHSRKSLIRVPVIYRRLFSHNKYRIKPAFVKLRWRKYVPARFIVLAQKILKALSFFAKLQGLIYNKTNEPTLYRKLCYKNIFWRKSIAVFFHRQMVRRNKIRTNSFFLKNPLHKKLVWKGKLYKNDISVREIFGKKIYGSLWLHRQIFFSLLVKYMLHSVKVEIQDRFWKRILLPHNFRHTQKNPKKYYSISRWHDRFNKWLNPVMHNRKLFPFHLFGVWTSQKKHPNQRKSYKPYNWLNANLNPEWRLGIRVKNMFRIKQLLLRKVILPAYENLNPKQLVQIRKKSWRIKTLSIENARADMFLGKFERRIDILIYKLNFAPTIQWARSYVQQGLVYVSYAEGWKTSDYQWALTKTEKFPLLNKLKHKMAWYFSTNVNPSISPKKPTSLVKLQIFNMPLPMTLPAFRVKLKSIVHWAVQNTKLFYYRRFFRRHMPGYFIQNKNRTINYFWRNLRRNDLTKVSSERIKDTTFDFVS